MGDEMALDERVEELFDEIQEKEQKWETMRDEAGLSESFPLKVLLPITNTCIVKGLNLYPVLSPAMKSYNIGSKDMSKFLAAPLVLLNDEDAKDNKKEKKLIPLLEKA